MHILITIGWCWLCGKVCYRTLRFASRVVTCTPPVTKRWSWCRISIPSRQATQQEHIFPVWPLAYCFYVRFITIILNAVCQSPPSTTGCGSRGSICDGHLAFGSLYMLRLYCNCDYAYVIFIWCYVNTPCQSFIYVRCYTILTATNRSSNNVCL